MDFLPSYFDSASLKLINTILFLFIFLVFVRTDWSVYSRSQINAFLGSIGFIFMIWVTRIEIRESINFHLLGAVAFFLMSGRNLSLIGMFVVSLLFCLSGKMDFLALGANYFVKVLPAVFLAEISLRLSQRFLPANYFIYIFVNAFFSAFFIFAVVTVLSVGILYLNENFTAGFLLSHILPFNLMLSWGEAFLTGMITSMIVVYRPTWNVTFEDSFYLNSNRRS